jgi:hypothetical protein
MYKAKFPREYSIYKNVLSGSSFALCVQPGLLGRHILTKLGCRYSSVIDGIHQMPNTMRRLDGNRAALLEPNGRVRLTSHHTVGTTSKDLAVGVGFH